MPPNSGARQRNTNHQQNDLKAFRAKYKQALPSLVELFPEWSQNDLLFVMDECQGDLDLAITRISEGHANQWGQVKSKKPKPKPAPTRKTNNKPPATDGKDPATRKSRKHRNRDQNKKEKQPKARGAEEPVVEEEVVEEEQKPSWASIAKGPVKPEVAPTNTTEEQKEKPAESPPSPPPTTVAANIEIHASIDATPDPAQEKGEEEEEDDDDDDKIADHVVEQVVDEESIEAEEEEKEATVDKAVAEQVVEQVAEQVIEQVVEQVAEQIAEQTVSKVASNNQKGEEDKASMEAITILSPVAESAVPAVRKPMIRRLNQTEPVVLPNNQQAGSLSDISVQFGSLTLSNGEETTTEVVENETEKAVEETAIVDAVEPAKNEVSQPPSEQPSSSSAAKESPAHASATATTATAKSKTPVGLPSSLHNGKPLPQPFQPQQPQPQPQPQPQQYPHPSQVQNEPYGYNPYAPYMHSNIGGYAMGAPSEYPMYGADPQRMNGYEASLYGQSPLVNNVPLFARDKFNTPPPMEMMNYPVTTAPLHPHHGMHPPPPPPPPPPQQQLGAVPYYSYYYQQQTSTGYPYVNKNMYNNAPKYDYDEYYNQNEYAKEGMYHYPNQMPHHQPQQQPQPLPPQPQQQQQQQQPYQPYQPYIPHQYQQQQQQRQQPYWHQA